MDVIFEIFLVGCVVFLTWLVVAIITIGGVFVMELICKCCKNKIKCDKPIKRRYDDYDI
jgi:hypothetical protein